MWTVAGQYRLALKQKHSPRLRASCPARFQADQAMRLDPVPPNKVLPAAQIADNISDAGRAIVRPRRHLASFPAHTAESSPASDSARCLLARPPRLATCR